MSWTQKMDEKNNNELMNEVSARHENAQNFSMLLTVLTIGAAFVLVLLTQAIEARPDIWAWLFMGAIITYIVLAIVCAALGSKQARMAKYGELLLNSRFAGRN